jgi:hypothetical protein
MMLSFDNLFYFFILTRSLSIKKLPFKIVFNILPLFILPYIIIKDILHDINASFTSLIAKKLIEQFSQKINRTIYLVSREGKEYSNHQRKRAKHLFTNSRRCHRKKLVESLRRPSALRHNNQALSPLAPRKALASSNPSQKAKRRGRAPRPKKSQTKRKELTRQNLRRLMEQRQMQELPQRRKRQHSTETALEASLSKKVSIYKLI